MTTSTRADAAETLLREMRRDRGRLPEGLVKIADYDPEYLRRFHQVMVHALGTQSHLSRQEKELVFVTVNAATYFDAGLRFHINEALEAGVDEQRIAETILIAALPGGVHVASNALPILQEVIATRRAAGAQQ